MKKMSLLLVAVLLLIVCLCGCAKTETRLVGVWEREGDRLELREDGTGMLGESEIHWLCIGDELQVLGDGGSIAFAVEFDGANDLELTANGETVRLARTK